MQGKRLVDLLYHAGFRGPALKKAYGIVMRESGGRADAFNGDRSTGDQSYGLFQINMLGDMGPARRRAFGIDSNSDLLNPKVNAKAAYKMSKGGKDFGAWGIGPNAYRSGAGIGTIQQYIDAFPGMSKLEAPSRTLAKNISKGQVVKRQPADATAAVRQTLMSYFIASNKALINDETPPDFAPYGVLARNQALEARQTPPKRPAAPNTVVRTPQAHKAAESHTTTSKGFLQAPTSWEGTHVTSGLGWGSQTAEDIMADAGTAVGAPEDGTIVYFHPTGAQGGGSMLLRTDAGEEVWLGHIAHGLPAGTRVKRGQKIAVISSDHPRPHLHIDERDI